MKDKSDEMSAISKIIVFDLVVLNSPFYRERMLVIVSQCVNKGSAEFTQY